MAVRPLQAESVCENTSPEKAPVDIFLEAHAAWRFAKAAWEGELYAPGMVGEDLPLEKDLRLCSDHAAALDRFMRTPSASFGSFIWKLRAFRDEECFNNENASETVSALLTDAERLLRETRNGQ